MSEQKKFCEKCGTPYIVGEKFCGNCGEKLDTNNDETIGVFSSNERTYTKPIDEVKITPKKKNTKLIVGIVLSIVLVLVIIGAVVEKSTPNPVTDDAVNTDFEVSLDTNVKKNVPYSKGILTETTYESEFIGVKFEVPSGWALRSKDEVASVFGEEAAQQVEMSAVHLATGSNLHVFAEKLPTKNATLSEYVEVLKQNWAGKGIEFSEDKGSITLLDESYDVLEFMINTASGTVKTVAYIRIKDDRMIYFMMQYLEQNQTLVEQVMDSFEIYNAKSAAETVDGLYLSYESENSKKPFMIGGSVFVTKVSSKAGNNWKYVEDNKEILTYFNLAIANGAENVVCLIDSEAGSMKGATYEIDDVINGYEKGTWSFDDAEEKYNEETNN